MNCDLCGESGPEPVGPISALSPEDQDLWESVRHRYPVTNICRVCWLQFVIQRAKAILTQAEEKVAEPVPSYATRYHQTPESRAFQEVEEAMILLCEAFGYKYTLSASGKREVSA